MLSVFKPKQTHPKWYLRIYPHLWMLRHAPKIFFLTIIGRTDWGWHGYEWEKIEYVDVEWDKAHRQSASTKKDIF
jgi:hypothetical protein